MHETTTPDAVLARLEALTARLDEQAAELAELKAENAWLTTAPATTTMATSPAPATTSRRGLLRRVLGASAAVAMLLVAKEPATARAVAHVSVDSTSTDQYGIVATIGALPTSVMVPPLGSTAHSVIGSQIGPEAPAFFIPTFNSGVLGIRSSQGAAGVQGINDAGPGVFGRSNTAIGVSGTSTHFVGVKGASTNGTGIEGSSATADGILGFSSGNLKYSLAGSGSGQAHGLVGFSQNQFGISGINGGGNNWAGAFFNAGASAPNSGKKGLFVQGDFLVLNGTKNAGVKTQRFGHRKMYAVEATENVFEDFGTATLKGGKARVELDEIFAETVNTGQKYQVYLTPVSGDSKGVGIVSKDAKGFTIQELGGGTGSYDVDYRVVAKVWGYEKTRMEQFEPPTMPKAPEPQGDLPMPTVVEGDKKEKR